MCKLTLRFVRQQMCHTPSMMDINKVNVGGHFTHLILTHSLSSSDWFDHLESLLSPRVGNMAATLFCFQSKVSTTNFDQC